MQPSDYNFIQKFNRGYRLPYSRYDESYIEAALLRKKNNAAAIIVCLDALTSYVADPDTVTCAENISMLCNEIVTFCVNGLFGIGFYGVSVENGFPIRVDSCGTNITKQYRSVYRNMSPEEYAAMDRIESMTLDQREERKFRQYILKYKYALETTLATVLDENDLADRSQNENVRKCLELDQLFCSVGSVVARSDMDSERNIWQAQIILGELDTLLLPHRGLLKHEDVAVIDDYTIAEMKPVSKTQISKYREAAESPSGKIN